MSTTKTEFKMFPITNPFAREDYFTEMAQKGWYYKSSFLSWYRFEQGEPKNRIYRLDYDLFRSGKSDDEYIRMFQDFGWHLHGKENGFYIFWTEDPEAGTEIFSDRDDWINVELKMYEQNLWLLLFLFIAIMVPFTYMVDTENLPRYVEIFSYIGLGIFVLLIGFTIGAICGIVMRKNANKR